MLKLSKAVSSSVPSGVIPVATAAYPTATAVEAWESLGIEILGPWGEEPHPAAYWLPQPPRVRYPENPRLNTVYWPTHAAGFAFAWVLMPESQLKLLDAETGVPGVATTEVWANWYDDNPGNMLPDWGISERLSTRMVKARMWLLRPKAIWVTSQAAEALWAVPLVDKRYFDNQTGLAPLDDISSQNWASVLRWALDSTFDWGLEGGKDFDASGYPDFNMDALAVADGPTGVIIDAILATMGRRACYIPEGYAERWFLPRAAVAMHPEDSAAKFDSSVAGWLALKRVGGRPRYWASTDLPNAFRVDYSVYDTTVGTGSHTWAIGDLIDLTDSGVISPGGVSPGGPIEYHLNYNSVFEATSGHTSELAIMLANARLLLARTAAWMTRPIDVVVAGMQPAVMSAHVGMWEWRTAECETAIHGLDPASAWYGADFRPSGDTRAILRVADWNYSFDPGGYLAFGRPAFVQRWDNTLGWVDAISAHPTINSTRVIDPNGSLFIPDEIIEAKLVRRQSFAFPVNLYSRTGLAGIMVNAPDPAGGAHGQIGVGTRGIIAMSPLYYHEAFAGQQINGLDITVSGGTGGIGGFSGILAGTPYPPIFPNGEDYHTLWYQWARAGATAFSNLGCNLITLGTGFPTLNAPGGNWDGVDACYIAGTSHAFSVSTANVGFSINSDARTASWGGGTGYYLDMSYESLHVDWWYPVGCDFNIHGGLTVHGSAGGTAPIFQTNTSGWLIQDVPGVLTNAAIIGTNGPHPFGGGNGWNVTISSTDIYLNGTVHFFGAPIFGAPLGVGSGGTGLATLPVGQLMAGNGTSPVASLSDTRLNAGGTGPEFKGANNFWVGFSKGNH